MYDKDAEAKVIARLTNWGIWSRIGGFPKLGTPAYVEIMRDYFPSGDDHITPNNKDAEHIEEIITTLDIAGRHGLGWGDIYRLIFKMEFVEHGRPQSVKADHIRWKFKQPCSERTYRYHWYRAKKVIYFLADPL